jgi:Protein of unknown function (DUF2628)
MRVYTVHENPSLFDDRRIVLVKEGFSWPVFFLTLFALPTVVWAIYRQVWLGLLFYFIGLVALGVIELMVGAAQPATGLFSLVYALLIAAEANDWRRRSMAGRGYREVAVVIGENLDDAEQRYFTLSPPPSPTPPPSHTAPETAVAA